VIAPAPQTANDKKATKPIITDPGKKEPIVEGKKGPPPVLGDVVQPPLGGRSVIGALETSNPMIDAITIVLTRGPEPGLPWERLDMKSPELRTSDPVMALPGYKADIKLNSQVLVHLWGNVPEQVAMKSMVMQSIVRFHPPAAGFDADLTLDAGRIYLTTLKKEGGARLRLRFSGETWDVSLADDRSEVMVQVHRAFIPGTPYAREGGEKPRTEAQLVVVRGSAGLNAPARFKNEKLATWSRVEWDSTSGSLRAPKAIEPNDPLSIRVPLIAGELGQASQKALSDAALKLTDRAGVRVLLEARINLEDARDALASTFAIYGYAAIADGPDTRTLIANLYDQLKERGRIYARKAAVVGISAWLARDPVNTALFHEVVTTQKGVPEDEADLIAQLLRGYSSREKGDPAAVDRLVEFLDHPNLIVREAALGNLIAFFDPDAARKQELGGLNVAARGEPGYEKALKVWKVWGEEMKKKMLEKK
jgi:hypothetical protein